MIVRKKRDRFFEPASLRKTDRVVYSKVATSILFLFYPNLSSSSFISMPGKSIWDF